MDEALRSMLERQAEWQRRRSQLSWAEKLRQSVAMRESLRGFRTTESLGRTVVAHSRTDMGPACSQGNAPKERR
jgi:hypothetical protein